MGRKTQKIYQPPTIQQIGEVDDVILGAAWMGDDIDTHVIIGGQEWCDDEDFNPVQPHISS